MPCNNTCCRSVWLKVCKVCDSTHSQLFPLTIPSELCKSLLCWCSCDLPTHIAVSQGRRSLQMEKSPHIPATPHQCPSHCSGPSAWLSAFVGFYRPIRAVIMNRFLCMWPLDYLISANCTLADLIECTQEEVISLHGQPLPRGDRMSPWLCLWQLCKLCSGSRMPQGGNPGAAQWPIELTHFQKWLMDRRPGNWNVFLKVLCMLNIFRTQIPFPVTYKNIFQSTLFNFRCFMNKSEAVGLSRLNGEASLHLSADSPKGIFGKRQKQFMNLKMKEWKQWYCCLRNQWLHLSF